MSTKMLTVNIGTPSVDETEAKEWVNELANVYADMEIEDVNVSNNKISFKAGFAGMDDTEPDDIKMKIEEYLTMNEAFLASNISVQEGNKISVQEQLKLSGLSEELLKFWYTLDMREEEDLLRFWNEFRKFYGYILEAKESYKLEQIVRELTNLRVTAESAWQKKRQYAETGLEERERKSTQRILLVTNSIIDKIEEIKQKSLEIEGEKQVKKLEIKDSKVQAKDIQNDIRVILNKYAKFNKGAFTVLEFWGESDGMYNLLIKLRRFSSDIGLTDRDNNILINLMSRAPSLLQIWKENTNPIVSRHAAEVELRNLFGTFIIDICYKLVDKSILSAELGEATDHITLQDKAVSTFNIVSTERTRVFICYSRRDIRWLRRLRIHLEPLIRDFGIDVWDDSRIKSGMKWRDEIREAIKTARVAILLISADFIASEFINRNELPPLLEAAKNEGTTILAVIVSASYYSQIPALREYQAVNDPSKPLINLVKGKQENVFYEIARAVKDLLEK
jgi:TIR domain